MPDATSQGQCTTCGAALTGRRSYCQACGATNLEVIRPASPSESVQQSLAGDPGRQAPLLTPRAPAAPQPPKRKPRWFLGTFWAVITLVLLGAGIVGPGKWLLLLAIATGAYSVYLYRGGRWGFLFFV